MSARLVLAAVLVVVLGHILGPYVNELIIADLLLFALVCAAFVRVLITTGGTVVRAAPRRAGPA